MGGRGGYMSPNRARSTRRGTRWWRWGEVGEAVSERHSVLSKCRYGRSFSPGKVVM